MCKLTNLKSLIEQEIQPLKKRDLVFSARHIRVKISLNFLQSATADLLRKTQSKSTVLMLLNGLGQSRAVIYL